MGKSVEFDYHDMIKDISALDFNYNPIEVENLQNKDGWFVDHYEKLIGTERPGPPAKAGIFEKAKDVLASYRFADPELIKAYFDDATALNGRNMLLIARFLGFHFRFGVRVTQVIDQIEKNKKGEEVQAWGFSYRTLKGHFEIGEITFKVKKNKVSGEITGFIDSLSKPDRISNPAYRVGFKIFGRHLQRRFAHSALERLKSLSNTHPDYKELDF